jgi:hypothetical protein
MRMSQDIVAVILLAVGLAVGFGYCRAFDNNRHR